MTLVNDFWEGEFDPLLSDVDYEDILIESGSVGSSPSPDWRGKKASKRRARSRDIAPDHQLPRIG